MTYRDILYETDGPIAVITLNRPDKLNAYTAVMGAELADAFHAADEDDAVRVIVVTGAGRGFCAGADISAGAASFDAAQGTAAFGDTRNVETRRAGGGFVDAIWRCRKPSIAAINGAAVGVGLTLTLPMDIRIAAETARFGFVFARRGLVPEAGSGWFLPRIVGLSQALKWCLTGRLFDAKEALAGGLVTDILPADEVLERAKDLAREIAENTAPVSIAITRQMLWRFVGADDPSELLTLDGALSMDLGAGPDVKEGVTAFLEKRPPAFPGKASRDVPARWTAFVEKAGGP
ncbi:MAG TPA: enoyl-CoA hydratase-related protein [Caulobacteraceae bacterium]|nr:enoyl-CoA hydratase-related protein [Caulobacteraceae bacterium]